MAQPTVDPSKRCLRTPWHEREAPTTGGPAAGEPDDGVWAPVLQLAEKPDRLVAAVWQAVTEIEACDEHVRAALHVSDKASSRPLGSGQEAARRQAGRADPTVYTGLAGVALMYWRLHRLHVPLSDGSKEPTARPRPWLARAQRLSTAALLAAGLTAGPRLPDIAADTFLTGKLGVAAVAAVVRCDDASDDEQGWTLARWVGQRLESAVTTLPPSVRSHELLYGLGGWLSCGDFVNEHMPVAGGPAISESVLTALARRIVDDGLLAAAGEKAHTHEAHPLPMRFAWHDSVYLGAAHGLTGIVHVLLKRPERLSARQLDAVRTSLTALHQRCFADTGNLPSSLRNGSDRLVQWCHGSPGWILTLARAAAALEDGAVYERWAVRASDDVWRRGLLTKGVGLCHGIGGNGYSFLALLSGAPDDDERLWHRALAFAHAIVQRPAWETAHLLRAPDRPYSLYEGLAGGVIYLADVWARCLDPRAQFCFLGYQ